jgi:probable F420-dependent oxidoreductase
MRIGIALPQAGPVANPETILRAAERAEALGYDSLWVFERLLHPTDPRAPYLPAPDGKLPEQFQSVYDPLETLAFVASRTSRIGLGTSILNIPYHNPLVLARRIATLDALSGGRVRVGLGLGWMPEEFEATGASFGQRGRRAEEFLQVMKAVWTTNPVEFEGEFYRIPRSYVGPKPVQQPHPPIYLAAFDPRGLDRVGRLANGWNPVVVPAAGMEGMMAAVRQSAQAAGRDPASLELVVRANLEITPEPLGADRYIFHGSLGQIAEDVRSVYAVGASELFFDAGFSPDSQTEAGLFRNLERLRDLALEATGELALTA